MLPEVDEALLRYFHDWQALLDGRNNNEFFADLQPMAVGWKVADDTQYRESYAELRSHCDRVVETWMNGRWIAKMHLRDKQLHGGIEIFKLMQRRPGSDDSLGLDHVDFYGPQVTGAEAVLRNESDLKWSWESNDVIAGYDWISVWFAGTEAKLKAYTVLDIVIRELEDINKDITQKNKKQEQT